MTPHAERLGTTLVVTPYHREPRHLIERCVASVAGQTMPVDHILVADGHPQAWIDDLPVRHIRLDRAHANFGNTPRAIGMMLGIAEGYGAIAPLDADNWLDPDHVAECRGAAARVEHCDYVIAGRRFCRPDGSVMPVPEEPIDRHVDTSCFYFLPSSYWLLPLWGTMPNPVSPLCDRVFYHAIRARGLQAAMTERPTVNFNVTVRGFFTELGEEPPPEAKDPPDFGAIQGWIDGLDDRQLADAARRAGVALLRGPQPPQ
ncbi:Glycosyl transferase family 2 [Sphingomonas laterariae]|uniref:Glycosyl transferase family 2 n=1 Tax=Edaphosphingomonas laterariae TaxID=861865 RepID=A0A239BDJ7_9SPHN|nr:glycosyltransferase [Sphingomonas laterariae]SNS05113.1 Glycosyl transferase family 2 [Sphingomonas laterariae]